ncbi:MAG: OmpA family protein, partial [Stellaceae bacterium]
GGLFASGSAAVNHRFATLLRRVGEELNTVKGKLLVVGYTDSTPIHTLRFPSNYELSLARANAVKTFISRILKTPGRMSAEGRGATDPIASNATRDGRAENRRIDIILIKPGATD